ncbi:thioesterase family protein, partial [Shewanella sp. 202IG2-18]|uniref:acyl-CoA thioesterase n=1 Tax=Parashewanella hymeniacidonis TaxID=2807618 RepID=UPI00196227D7
HQKRPETVGSLYHFWSKLNVSKSYIVLSIIMLDFFHSRLIMQQPNYFTVDLSVRVADLNYGNHLGYNGLVSMLHHARIDYFRNFKINEFNLNGATSFIKQLKIDYQGEAFLHDVLHFNYSVSETTRATITFEALITKNDDNAPVAHAFETMILVDNETKKVVKNSAGFAKLIEYQGE